MGTDYLEWAIRFFPQARFNLARGGISAVPFTDVGTPAALDDARGWTVLRERIATFTGVDPARIVPTLGATHALWLACVALVRPGDEVLVETPRYEPLAGIPASLGARVVPFERRMADAFALDVDRIVAAITPRTRAVAITTLHNPTGMRAPATTLTRLARACAERGARLLVDEVYAGFEGDGATAPSAHVLDENIVAVSALSKTHGLGGLRIGWMIGPLDVVHAAQRAMLLYVGDPFPHAHANLAAHAFARLPDLGAQARAALPAKRAIVEQWIASQPGLAWNAPDAGPFGWVVLRSGKDLRPLVEARGPAEGVLVAPGGFFGVTSAFRIGWSIAETDLPNALSHLERVLAGAL